MIRAALSRLGLIAAPWPAEIDCRALFGASTDLRTPSQREHWYDTHFRMRLARNPKEQRRRAQQPNL